MRKRSARYALKVRERDPVQVEERCGILQVSRPAANDGTLRNASCRSLVRFGVTLPWTLAQALDSSCSVNHHATCP